MNLTGPVGLAGLTAPARVVFGPHVTNLGRDRAISERHVAYYARRAAGGAGIVVTETASVTADDWPYERAPLAADCGPGWRAVADACHEHGTLVLAGLGHAGGQGSSAYSQSVLLAPSRVADVVSREMPAEMEQADIDAVVRGFASAARLAAASGLDGVELDAAVFALLRQFHSGLTNQRGDAYGADKLRLTREVIAAVRTGIGPDRILALRMSCDELAPWAGITPEIAAGFVTELDGLDLLVVVRAGPFATHAARPDAHTPPGFAADLCRTIREAVAGRFAVVLQGSVVDVAAAQQALDDGVCDLVEMTRAQIAEPRLVALARAGTPERIRPCLLCNQACQVRDSRNPLVSCVADPDSGYETTVREPGPGHGDVLIAGGGPAGLECARVLATRGFSVTVAERSELFGGALRTAAAGRPRLALLADWLEAECVRLGVKLESGREVRADDAVSVVATGSRPVARWPGAVDVLAVFAGAELPDGAVVVHDPIGGAAGVAVAEWLAGRGRDVALVTSDQIAGTQLALSGDLAPANTRLQQAGVRRELRALLRSAGDGTAVLEDVWTGVRREIPCDVLVDCGHRLPEPEPGGETRIGDCVAPRTVLEAVLEGRRAGRAA